MDFGFFVLIFFGVLGLIKAFQDMKKDEEERYRPGYNFKMKDTVGKFHY